MTQYFGLFQFGVLTSISFAILVAIISFVVYPLVRPVLNNLSPAWRSNVLLAWLLAPVCLGLCFTLLAMMPSLHSMFGISPDHCNVHDGHMHLCLIHPPLPVDGLLSLLLSMLIGGGSLLFVVVYSVNLLRACKHHKMLMVSSWQYDKQDIRIVEWSGPLAISVGIFRMHVFISEQLIQALKPHQLDIVLAHEQAHVERKDTLRHLLGHAISFAHIPWLRKRLLADMGLACEQACDEIAALGNGGRLQVADTIVSVERMFTVQHKSFSALSIVGSSVIQRVESLLRNPASGLPFQRTYFVLLSVLILIVSFNSVESLHHHTESILGLLTR